MVTQDVHHDRESEDVATHHQHEEDNLRDIQGSSSKASHEDLAGVGHAVDLHISAFELSDGVARVGGDDSDGDDGDDATARISACTSHRDGQKSYGTSPKVARAFGSARIPREMVSAIITD